MEALQNVSLKAEKKLRDTTNKIIDWLEKKETKEDLELKEIERIENEIVSIYQRGKAELRQAIEEQK